MVGSVGLLPDLEAKIPRSVTRRIRKLTKGSLAPQTVGRPYVDIGIKLYTC